MTDKKIDLQAQDQVETQIENRVTIYIDNVAHQVDPKDNLLAGVLSEKLNLPYFCWHPSMGSVGACRQCAVTQFQDENDTRGRMVMSCMTPVVEGMRIGLKDPASSKFREQVIAAMMTNHPHDCPVCAEGGECHLQDMTVMTGHTSREYCGSKRTFENQYLGELVGHEMNRCITCYRCVRFYKDYAGGDDFGVYGSSNHVYFGRQKDGVLESEFSGNLVEVCPTGVFTNKLFSAHYTRKWDLQSAPSICAHCSVGCNTSIGERYGSVRRVVNRYNPDINGYFLCDRGRFGIGFVNGEQRIRQAHGFSNSSSNSNSNLKSTEQAQPLTNLDVAKTLVHHQGEKFIGIGSARASLEANFYLKQLVGEAYFSVGYSSNEMGMAAQHIELLNKYSAPSLSEIEKCDFVFIIGEDITQTSPRVALSVRQALRNASFSEAATLGVPTWQDAAVRTIGGTTLSPLFMLNSLTTKLDNVAQQCLYLTPNEVVKSLSRLTADISTMLLGKERLDESNNTAFNDDFISALVNAKKPLIISGYSLQSVELLAEIKRLMTILHSEAFLAKVGGSAEKAKLTLLPQACNSLGVLSLLDEHTLSFEQVLEQLSAKNKCNESNQAQSLIILEQELSAFDDQQIALLRQQAKTLIVLEHSQSRLSQCADIVMPVAAVSEGDGHYLNYQSVAQRYHQVHAPKLPIQDSWRWLDAIANVLFSGSYLTRQTKTCLQHRSLTQLHQFFTDSFTHWPLANVEQSSLSSNSAKGIARQTHRASGRTSLMANERIHESKATQGLDDAFTFSMEGLSRQSAVKNSAEMPFTWAPGWNSNQSIAQYKNEISAALTHQKQHSPVPFAQASDLLEKWCSASSANAEVLAENEPLKILIFVQQTTWYQGDWQSKVVPEFIMQQQSNRLAMASQDAKAQGWHDGQYVLLHFQSSIEVVAQIQCDDKLSSGMAFGNIAELPLEQSCLPFTLSPSDEKTTASYQQQYQKRMKQAELSKENILNRLKENDQHIPIRLVSGGLDDV